MQHHRTFAVLAVTKQDLSTVIADCSCSANAPPCSDAVLCFSSLALRLSCVPTEVHRPALKCLIVIEYVMMCVG